MENTIQMLTKRKKQLEKIAKDKEKSLGKAPEGYLRLSKHGKGVQYYYRNDPKDLSGVYIKKKDRKLAQRLAQKDYDEKVLLSIKKEINAIDKYLLYASRIYPENVYESLHTERQKLICPMCETEAQFVAQWESMEYSGKEFDAFAPKLYTARGERVRSKSEVIIADSLNREGIPYRYECPLYVEGWGTVHPDFMVLNVKERKEIYWEHLGMMDDREYVEKALDKLAVYAVNGILPGKNLILTYETAKAPLNQKMVQMMIEQYLI